MNVTLSGGRCPLFPISVTCTPPTGVITTLVRDPWARLILSHASGGSWRALCVCVCVRACMCVDRTMGQEYSPQDKVSDDIGMAHHYFYRVLFLRGLGSMEQLSKRRLNASTITEKLLKRNKTKISSLSLSHAHHFAQISPLHTHTHHFAQVSLLHTHTPLCSNLPPSHTHIHLHILLVSISWRAAQV